MQRARDRASVEEARRIWIQGLESDRAADSDAATAAAAALSASAPVSTTEQASSVAALSGRGILSFLDPPTSEAEAFAAAALNERYRLLGEEADARAARARWKRQRSERTVAARASLNMLYAKEASAWKVMAAEAARGVGETTENRGIDAVLSTDAAGGNGGSVGNEKDAEHGNTEGKMAIEIERGEDVVAQGRPAAPESAPSPLPPPPAAQLPPLRRSRVGIPLGDIDAAIADKTGQDRHPSGHGGAVMAKEQATSTAVERDSRQGDRYRDDTKFSPVTIVQEPGGKSAGMSAALGKRAGETLLDRTPPLDDPPLKFSHVKIVQTPGGRSDGVSRALGADAGGGDDTRAPSALGMGVETTQDLCGKASSVSRVSSSASLLHVAGFVDGAVQRLGDAVLGNTDGNDNLESRETQASDIDFASVLHALEMTTGGEDSLGSHIGESLQDGQSSRRSSVDVAEATSEARVGAEGSGDAGEPQAAVGRTIGFAFPTAKVRERNSSLLGDELHLEGRSWELYVR